MVWSESTDVAGESGGRTRPRLVSFVGVLLAFGLTAAVTGSAIAQTPLESARADVAEAADRVEALNLEIAAAQGRADKATAEFWEHQEAVYVLEAAIDGLSTSITGYDTEIDELKDEMQRLAIERYMEPANYEAALDVRGLNDKLRADALASFVTDTSSDTIDDFRKVSVDRETSRAELEASLAEIDTAAAAAAKAGETLTAELQGLFEQREELVAELDELRANLATLEAEEARRVAAEQARRAAEEQAAADERAAAEALAVEQAAAEEAAAELERALAAEAAATALAETVPTPEPTASPFTPADATEPEAAEPEDATAQEPSSQSPTTPDSGEQAQEVVTTTPETPSAPIATPVEPAPSFVCPLTGPFSHIDDYGAPRPGGNAHQGNDLMAAAGTPVVAAVAGQLEHRFGTIGGYTARVKTNDGGWYYYAHLSAYENQGAGYVEAGTVIGYVGNTGDAAATPPHLHFEMHPAGYGRPTNPYSTVARYC